MLLRPSDFYKYQPKAIAFIKEHRYCALWVGMRLGKTVTVLSALQDLIDTGEVRRILVVAPLRVSINSWPEDLDGWAQLTLNYNLIRGTEEERLELLKIRSSVHIINHEMVPWLINTIGKDDWPYDTLVIDESRKYKNHAKKTPKKNLSRFGSLCFVRPKIRRVIELTGTPAPLGYLDLWSQIYLLDGGKRLGKNITAFRDQYCYQGRYHYIWNIQNGADIEIREKIRDLVFVVDSKDQIDLPQVNVNPVFVDLPPEIYKSYKTLEKEFIAEVRGRQIVTFSSGSKSMKLLQMASGRVYLDDETLLVHREKEDALAELLELIEGPVLIIYNFVFEKEWILEKYKDAKLLDSDPQTVKRWQQGKIDKLVMHPASGGHGLNLYHQGHDIIWVSPTWDLELWEQTNMRLSHPSKSDEIITIHSIRARKTIENQVMRSLELKKEVQQHLLKTLARS